MKQRTKMSANNSLAPNYLPSKSIDAVVQSVVSCRRRGRESHLFVALWNMSAGHFSIVVISYWLLSSCLCLASPLLTVDQNGQHVGQVLLLTMSLPGDSQTRSVRSLPFHSTSTAVAAHSPDAPKLIPLSALDRYQEGTDLRLFCSASAPQSGGRLHFEWRKNSNDLLALDHRHSSTSGDDDDDDLKQQHNKRLQISMMDESASVLRIGRLNASDSGNYTCFVRNQHGFDSSTVRVNVNVKLKWTVEPPGELHVRAGKSVQIECDASGQPAPQISWTSLQDRHQHTIGGKFLRLDRVSQNDSGLYECRAQSAAATGDKQRDDQLRKVVRLVVNGK